MLDFPAGGTGATPGPGGVTARKEMCQGVCRGHPKLCVSSGSAAFPGESSSTQGSFGGHREVGNNSLVQLKPRADPRLGPVPLTSPNTQARPSPHLQGSSGEHLDFTPSLLHIFQWDFVSNKCKKIQSERSRGLTKC